MAKRSLVFSEGEFGFIHNFNVKKEDGTNANLTGFTGVRLIIFDEVADVAKLDITSDLVIASPQVQWTIQNGQTDYNGTFTGALHLTAAGQNDKVYHFPVIVAKKLV